MPDTATQCRIHAFWDELADFDAADISGAREFFLKSLCHLLDAQNATWVGAVRMDNPQSADPLNGWRPRAVHRLFDPPRSRRLQTEKARSVERGRADIVTIRRVAQAGTFRVHRLVDIVPEGWFDADYYKQYYLADGVRDTLYAGIPINHDVEIYAGLVRNLDHEAFSPEDVATFTFALRGLKWFHRRQLLGEGIGVVSEPLTPAERRVLEGLLGGLSEKQIAHTQGQSRHTIHDYVKSLFRKYGVSSRAELMALWLGAAPP